MTLRPMALGATLFAACVQSDAVRDAHHVGPAAAARLRRLCAAAAGGAGAEAAGVGEAAGEAAAERAARFARRAVGLEAGEGYDTAW